MKKYILILFLLIIFIPKVNAYTPTGPLVIDSSNNTYDSLQSCIDNSDNCVIIRNIEVTDKIVINKDSSFTLDFQGHTLSASGSNFTNNELIIVEKGDVVLKNGFIICDKNIIKNKGILTIEYDLVIKNIKIDNEGTLTYQGEITKTEIGIENKGTLTVTGGQITASEIGINNHSNGKVIMYGGGITGNIGINNYGTGTVDVEGGQITGNIVGIKTSPKSLTTFGGSISGNGDVSKLRSNITNLYQIKFLNNIKEQDNKNHNIAQIFSLITLIFIFKSKKISFDI